MNYLTFSKVLSFLSLLGFLATNSSAVELPFSGEYILIELNETSHVEVEEESFPLLESLDKKWDANEFNIPRKQIELSSIPNLDLFNQPLPQELREIGPMLIKTAGQGGFRIPSELGQFEGSIQEIVNSVASLDSSYLGRYAYLRVRQGLVKNGYPQKIQEIHADGVPGSRYLEMPTTDYYVGAANALPTTNYFQAFDLSQFNRATESIAKYMEMQALETAAYHGEPGKIYLTDSYIVHHPSNADADVWRTWINISFSYKRFEGLDSVINPAYGELWDFVDRTCPFRANGVKQYFGPLQYKNSAFL